MEFLIRIQFLQSLPFFDLGNRVKKAVVSQGVPLNLVVFPVRDGSLPWVEMPDLITTTACHMEVFLKAVSLLSSRGDDATTESEYVGGFCMDRKINLTPYIKWWGPNKSKQSESHGKSPDETNPGSSEDIGSELKPPEWATQPTEPYQLPRLGVTHEGKQHKRSSVSAMSILSRSAVEKSSYDDVNEGFGAELGMVGLQRNTYPLAPFLSAPLLTSYNTVDPL